MTPVEHKKEDGIIRVYEKGWQVYDLRKHLLFYKEFDDCGPNGDFDAFANSRLAGACDTCGEFLCHMAGREPLAGDTPKPPPAADAGGICFDG